MGQSEANSDGGENGSVFQWQIHITVLQGTMGRPEDTPFLEFNSLTWSNGQAL